MITAVYPGSFDPITNGHIDIVKRASKIFDRVIMAIYSRPDKRLFFTTEERVELAREATVHLLNVVVMPFTGLTTDFARQLGAKTMVRGMRTGSDFEREFDLAMMNKRLNPDLELVCLMASQEYQFLSSSILKEVARLGGKVDDLVPPHVLRALLAKLNLVVSGPVK